MTTLILAVMLTIQVEQRPNEAKLGDFLEPARQIVNGIVRIATFAERAANAIERVGRAADALDRLATAASYLPVVSMIVGLGTGYFAGVYRASRST